MSTMASCYSSSSNAIHLKASVASACRDAIPDFICVESSERRIGLESKPLTPVRSDGIHANELVIKGLKMADDWPLLILL